MDNDLHTDEYAISLSREIVVCRNMIRGTEKRLAWFEKHYSLATDQLVRENQWLSVPEERARLKWQHEYKGLLAWRQLLREYEAAYQLMK